MYKTLNQRVLEAKAIAGLGKIAQRKSGKVAVVIVPGSEGTLNHVIIRKHSGNVISTECRKVAGNHGYAACKGNLAGFCRHSIAAIIMALQDAGYKPAFRKEFEDAEKLAASKKESVLEYEGKPVIFTLKSWQSANAKNLYMVAIDETAEELTK